MAFVIFFEFSYIFFIFFRCFTFYVLFFSFLYFIIWYIFVNFVSHFFCGWLDFSIFVVVVNKEFNVKVNFARMQTPFFDSCERIHLPNAESVIFISPGCSVHTPPRGMFYLGVFNAMSIKNFIISHPNGTVGGGLRRGPTRPPTPQDLGPTIRTGLNFCLASCRCGGLSQVMKW